MRTFDACSDAGEHAFPVEVRVALATLSRRLGDVMLVGSWARDVCLVLDAWLDPGRMSDDLDVAVATSSLRELDERLGELGPRGGHGVRIYVEGVGVDVLPYGGLASDGIVQTSADSQLDVTCMAEAWRHADRLHVGDDVVIRTASLPLMVALKLVAWDVRSPGTDKMPRTSAGSFRRRTSRVTTSMPAMPTPLGSDSTGTRTRSGPSGSDAT